MLPLVIRRELGDRRLDVLELAPKACFTNFCRRQRDWSYVSSDLDSPLAMVHADLRAMPFAANTFDLIACCHVMEHIKDDVPAFAEIGRMLKPDGLGIICVPVRGELTQEGAPKEDWERLYGQADHVRYYGLDIEDRMRRAQLAVRRVDTLEYFSPRELDRHALRGDDRYLFLVKKAVPT
jgi:SAM-dependent methyltransferase